MSLNDKHTETRRRMPADRKSITHSARVSGLEFYITAGMYESGQLGEVFIKGAGKEGSTVQSLLDAYATLFSIGLQYGAELDVLVMKFVNVKFEPFGTTNNPQIPLASSVLDYMVTWLAYRFGSRDLQEAVDKAHEEAKHK